MIIKDDGNKGMRNWVLLVCEYTVSDDHGSYRRRGKVGMRLQLLTGIHLINLFHCEKPNFPCRSKGMACFQHISKGPENNTTLYRVLQIIHPNKYLMIT